MVPPKSGQRSICTFLADNVDINEHTFDGIGTFHATQVAAWQRGPPKGNLLSGVEIHGKSNPLNIPREMNDVIPPTRKGVTDRPFDGAFSTDTSLKQPEECHTAVDASAKDMAFFLCRSTQKPVPTWTWYNKMASTVNPKKTTVGYLPIIQAPASELDTLNTVVKRVFHLAKSINQKHVVLTVDEALYPELKWSVEDYNEVLIPCLRGLHVAMNFLGVIGRHMNDSGLVEVWVESDLLSTNAAHQVITGKGYARAIRAHKITLQVLWRLLPRLHGFLEKVDLELMAELEELESTKIDAAQIALLVRKLSSEKFQHTVKEFATDLIAGDPNVAFWWQYMNIVTILLCFTRAHRDGLWDLHLYAFSQMLPFFFRYDHINYARWGSVYLAEMSILPPEVLQEFQQGNFVVKKLIENLIKIQQIRVLNGRMPLARNMVA